MPITKEGVVFYANNVDKAFEMAKAEGKPLFIEIYSESCHVCQSFIPIFNTDKVSEFYNETFFNYRIEVNSPEFQSFVLGQKIFVPSLPLLLYFDQNRNLTHLATIDANAEQLVEQGKIALDPERRADSMKRRFEAGERDNQFLIDYALFSKVTMDTVANRKAMEIYASQQPESSYSSETNYLAIQKLLMDVENPLGKYFVTHLPVYRQGRDAAEVKNVAENLIMSSLYSSFGNQYSSTKIKQMRDYMINAEIDPQVARNRVLLPLINAYFRENTPQRAVDLVNTHITQVPLKVPDYAYLLKYFNERSPDASYVPSAERWAANALKMAPKGSEEEVNLRMELAAAKRRQ
ncbi:DUF255 domain-containing protein [Persicitalea jodogahamensis]|uniref:DUF255 domain-containing protein n=1 Tax=Persicitalea jodogahamensis TaxID=402147 RepID=UPI00167BDDB6|nr:DUF255 domain-containing protein [Persicitalea jodogahamensis]